MKENNLRIEDIDEIVFYEDPKLKMDRILKTFISNSPRNFNLFSKAFISQYKKWKQLKREFPNLQFIKHHQSHAASAFYPSPFKEAVIVTLDGVGEWDTASVSVGIGNKLKMIQTNSNKINIIQNL